MSKKTILIVDDTFENLYLLKVILEEEGYNIIEANDGADGLKKLKEVKHVDLIISDILMPNMDGYLFCQACRKEKMFADIPFVFYTSTYTEKLDEDFALKLGATSFLRKPIDHDEVVNTVNNIFNTKKEQLVKPLKVGITEGEVLKLYSERLISKLEQKSLDLEHEVLERKKAEQLLIQKNEVLDLISVSTPLDKIFEKVLLNYQASHPNYFGTIGLLEEDGVHLSLISAPSMPESYNSIIKRIQIGEKAGSCGTAAYTKKPVIVSDISTDRLWEDYKELAASYDLKSCWSIPILSKDNNVQGTFAIYSKSISTPSSEDIRELNLAVSLVNIVIERVRIVEEIRKKDESYKSLIDHASDAIIIYNLEGEIFEFNNSTNNALGYTKKQFSKLKVQDVIVGEMGLTDDNHIKMINGESILFERQLIRKDKSIIDVEVSSRLQKDGRILGIARDISERKKNQLEIKLAKEFTDKLIMSMQEGLIIIDMVGKIILINDSVCKMLGYTEQELIGLEMPYPFAKEEDFKKITNIEKDIAKGEAPSFQLEFIRKNGEHFLASFLIGHIKNNTGDVIALFGTLKDVSEEEKSKQVLINKAKKSNLKKEAILKLAGLVGKDFNKSLREITKLAAKTLNVGRVSVWSINKNKNAINCENLYVLNKNSYEKGLQIKHEDNPSYFNAINVNQTILVTDAQNDELTKLFTKNYLKPNNITSFMDVGINSASGYYGIICFEHVGDSLRNWTAQDLEFATSIASIVSLMVESNERKIAENKITLTNAKLVEVNAELNSLQKQLKEENVYLRNELDLVFNYEEMVYGSVEFSNVLSEVEKVAPTNATVLLLGESGTGKELLARAIHNTSLRNSKPLIKVNCSAIPRELIESELFGHKKGSFTGAYKDKIGKFELANEGTLFLDEIGELPLDMQPKILRFLQEGEIEVVGGNQLKKLNVRVIAATNRNLLEQIEKKQFREDLYFRLNVFPIDVPPLRKRKDDIPLLIHHFVDKFNKSYDKQIKLIPDDSMNKLLSYHWPGNIRELENLVERASILSNGETLLVPGFESENQKTKHLNNKDSSLEAIQRTHILHVLGQCNWKISGPESASLILDLKPSTLRDKMIKLGIQKPVKN